MLETWKGVDVYTRLLPYFDKTTCCIPDPAHMIYNTVCDMLALICNMGPAAYTPVRRQYDVVLGRSYAEVAGRRPWRMSSARERELDAVLDEVKASLPNSWPDMKSAFSRLADVGVAEGLMFAGPLGVYIISQTDIDPLYKKMFCDLLWCLERLQGTYALHVCAYTAFVLPLYCDCIAIVLLLNCDCIVIVSVTKLCAVIGKYVRIGSLDGLQSDLVDALTECEIRLPVNWSTSVRHHLLHIVDQIRRVGPFKDHNMLPFERWHTFLKKLCRGRRNLEISIHNHYNLTLSGKFWRLPSQGGHAFCTPAAASTVAGADARRINHQARKALPLGKVTLVELSEDAFRQIQDVWCIEDADLDNFRDRYRTLVRDRNAVLPEELTQDQIDRLRPTPRQLLFLTMPREAGEINRADYNGNIFATYASCRFKRSDNSFLKQTYNDEDGEPQPSFCRITGMFLHAIIDGYPQSIVVKCDWFDFTGEYTDHGLPVVRRDPDRLLNFNRNCQYTFLEGCHPYNITVLPRCAVEPDNQDLVVLDPEGKFGEGMNN